MKVFLKLTFYIVCIFVVVSGQRASRAKQTQPQKPPKVDWGKCSQLESTQSENARKNTLRETCLKAHPIPKQLNEKTARAHARLMTECALRQDNWFDRRGKYRFGKTKTRLMGRNLPKPIETEIVGHIGKCRAEAEKKFPGRQQIIDVVLMFQACMDFHTTKTCEIKLISQ